MRQKLFFQFAAFIAALGLAACGDDPMSVEEEPAGENCAEGGIRIESEGELRFICHPEPPENKGTQDKTDESNERLRIERIPAGESGGRCPDEAIRIIAPSGDDESDSEDELICLAPTLSYAPLQQIVEARRALFELYAPLGDCVFDDPDDASSAAFGASMYEQIYLMTAVNTRCAAEVLSVLGPPPPGSEEAHWMECSSLSEEADLHCTQLMLNEAEDGICARVSDAATHPDCVTDFFDASALDCDDAPAATPEGEEWDRLFALLSAELSCRANLVVVD